MTPKQLAQARQRLGLTLEQMAAMLGYDGINRRIMMHKLEHGQRPIREPQRRLVEAYLSGYRPTDWPVTDL
jgi:transcriptional regulator with XRE-family HTH domain